MNKLTVFYSSCCNSSTFRSLSSLIHRRKTNDVQCVNTKVTNVVLDWIEREICIDIVTRLSSQTDINLVHVDLSMAVFLRNSGPGNMQTFGTLCSNQDWTRCDRGNWKIENLSKFTCRNDNTNISWELLTKTWECSTKWKNYYETLFRNQLHTSFSFRKRVVLRASLLTN